MSMLALPETECQEILSLFRQHLPHVPDIWLQELAGNYGLDAIKDIDPNDVIAILSVYGELLRIYVPLEEHELMDEVNRRMCDEMALQGISPAQISSCLMMIHSSSLMLKDISKVVGRFSEVCAIEDKRGWACYVHEPNPVDSVSLWIRFRTNDLS